MHGWLTGHQGAWFRACTRRGLALALLVGATAVTLAGCIVAPGYVAPAPVYYAPAPVVVAPAPVVVYGRRGWRRW